MGWPVVTVTSGGIAVTDASATGFGIPVEEAANGMGTAVTYVASGGIAVVGGSHAPVAPILAMDPAWVTTDNTPDFTIDAAWADQDDLQFEIQTSGGDWSGATVTHHTVVTSEIGGTIINFALGSKAAGSYQARCKFKHFGGSYSSYSNIQAFTIIATATKWNSADKSLKIGLDVTELIATFTSASGGTFESIRTVASDSTGLRFYQAVANNMSSGLVVVGIGNAAASLSNFAGSDSNSVGWVLSNGVVNIGGSGSAFGSIQTAVAGDTLGIAINLTTMRAWFRTNSGNWNNTALANPATGVSGIDISGLAAGPYFPMATLRTTNEQVTANFDASTASPAAPAGALNW